MQLGQDFIDRICREEIKKGEERAKKLGPGYSNGLDIRIPEEDSKPQKTQDSKKK